MAECSICFTQCAMNLVCQECKTPICNECIRDMIRFCHKQPFASIPRCPATDCISEYLYSKIKKCLDEETMEMYQVLCKKCLMVDPFKAAEDLKTKMIKSIREKRNEARKQFNPAISKLISICLMDKLVEIDKDLKKKIDVAVTGNVELPKFNYSNAGYERLGMKCSVADCDGDMVNNICGKCESETCRDCGMLKKWGHICKEEDISSLKAIESFIKCPVCRAPIQKSEGCLNMTCMICRTNFCYNTGERSRFGSHENRLIELRTTDMQQHNAQFISSFEEAVSYKPKMLKDTGRDAAQSYEIFAINRMRAIKTEKIIQEINKRNDTGSLTQADLNNFMRELKEISF
jgi:SNF2 family DNA or RNA helicase